MSTCTHPATRNGYCTACLCRVPTTVDALLVGTWSASLRRLNAGGWRRASTKRLLLVGKRHGQAQPSDQRRVTGI